MDLLFVHGLEQIVIRMNTVALMGIFIGGRKENDVRGFIRGADFLRKHDAVQYRHDDIQNLEIKRFAARRSEHVFAVSELGDLYV